jgi:hypothetical protein
MAASDKRADRKGALRTRAARRGVVSTPSSEPPLVGVARQLREWTDSVFGIAGAAADASLSAAKAVLAKPEQRAALEKAGRFVRRMREGAGLTLGDVGTAIDLNDPTLLELVERGKLALPFEITLRLAAVLARNDPISFVMRLTRSYNPETWAMLEKLGIGRLAVQAGREHELTSVYRANDAARRLSDHDFAAVLAFTKQAFDMGVAFRTSSARRGTRHAAETSSA